MVAVDNCSRIEMKLVRVRGGGVSYLWVLQCSEVNLTRIVALQHCSLSFIDLILC